MPDRDWAARNAVKIGERLAIRRPLEGPAAVALESRNLNQVRAGLIEAEKLIHCRVGHTHDEGNALAIGGPLGVKETARGLARCKEGLRWFGGKQGSLRLAL